MIINGDLKIDYLFFTLIIDAFEYPNYKYIFLIYSKLSMECTNPIATSSHFSRLDQPAPKLESDLYNPKNIK